MLLRRLIGLSAALFWATSCLAAEPLEIKIGYLHGVPSKIRLSLMDVPADNDGLAGAQLAIDDNNTTGRFTNQHFTLIDRQTARRRRPGGGGWRAGRRRRFVCRRGPRRRQSAEGRRRRKGARRRADQRRGHRRSAARGGLPRQCRACRADALDAGRRPRPVSGLEEMAQMAADRRLARQGQAPRRGASPLRGALRRENRRRARVSRIPAARDAPTAASSRFNARCRF